MAVTAWIATAPPPSPTRPILLPTTWATWPFPPRPPLFPDPPLVSPHLWGGGALPPPPPDPAPAVGGGKAPGGAPPPPPRRNHRHGDVQRADPAVDCGHDAQRTGRRGVRGDDV